HIRRRKIKMKEIMELVLSLLKEIISTAGKIITTWISNKSQDKKTKTEKSDNVVEIPPKSDPISHLKGDSGGIKDIDQMTPLTDEYYKALATRLALAKSKNTKI